jgi:hypothetical protein
VSQAWLKQLPPGITPLILAYNASSVPITRLALSRRSIPEQGLFDRDASPPALDIQPIGDQSLFVKGAISGVVREGVIAASLTGLMILLFLGSWRSPLASWSTMQPSRSKASTRIWRKRGSRGSHSQRCARDRRPGSGGDALRPPMTLA